MGMLNDWKNTRRIHWNLLNEHPIGSELVDLFSSKMNRETLFRFRWKGKYSSIGVSSNQRMKIFCRWMRSLMEPSAPPQIHWSTFSSNHTACLYWNALYTFHRKFKMNSNKVAKYFQRTFEMNRTLSECSILFWPSRILTRRIGWAQWCRKRRLHWTEWTLNKEEDFLWMELWKFIESLFSMR